MTGSTSSEILQVCLNSQNQTITGCSKDSACDYCGGVKTLSRSSGTYTLKIYNITSIVQNNGGITTSAQLCVSSLNLLLTNYTASILCEGLSLPINNDNKDNTTTRTSSCQCDSAIASQPSHSQATPSKCLNACFTELHFVTKDLHNTEYESLT